MINPESLGFAGLPFHIQQHILMEAGFLSAGISEATTLELVFPKVIDHNHWKERFFNLFPNIKFYAQPPKTATAEEKKLFWKTWIKKIGSKILLEHDLYPAIFFNDIRALNEMLPRFDKDDLVFNDHYLRAKEFYLYIPSPASLAGFLGRKEILNSLYRHAIGTDNENSLWWACAFNQREQLEQPNEITNWNQPYQDMHPLWIASAQGYLSIVEKLIIAGVDMEFHGNCSLVIACAFGYLDIVNILIQEGVNINHVSDFGQTPLLEACEHGQLDIVTKLIECGAMVNQVNPNTGKSPIMIACEHGHFDIVKALIKAGSLVNQDIIDIAVQLNHIEIARILMVRFKLPLLDEPSLLQEFKNYVSNYKNQFLIAPTLRFFQSPIGNHFGDLVKEALLHRKSNNLSLGSFINTLKLIAKQREINLFAYPSDALYALLHLSILVLDKEDMRLANTTPTTLQPL